ncbi:MAG: twin-arginine translocase TatA/TatE family subunit [Nitrospirae bacterium]|nr:twin-arginine translocase TatA/TatE family subunit [Nitrospirota bacterium]
MFGTMGISELIIILVIVLIIFGAGRLPQIGEGVGKALKGFKKEVNEVPQPAAAQTQQETAQPQPAQGPPIVTATQAPATSVAPAIAKPNVPYVPGPEMTPGTTASLLYNVGPQAPQTSRTVPHRESPAAPAQHVVSMEERTAAPSPMARGQYPPLPPGAQAKPAVKRPSAIVNKDAVARVQAQQAALKVKAAQSPAGVSPEDMQSLGEGVGDVLKTFRQAVADVRNSVDPSMRTIQAEMDAAQKEIQQSLEAAKEIPVAQEDPSKPA